MPSQGVDPKRARQSDRARGESPLRLAPRRIRGMVAALFPIVGIGASAGGLEAFTELLKHLLLDTGMGFVMVQHLAPERVTSLAEILSRLDVCFWGDKDARLRGAR